MADPDPDWSNPCAVLAWLRPKYYLAISGGTAVSVKYGGREIEYSSRFNNLPQLETLLRKLERDCAVASGTSRRQVILAGSGQRRRFDPFSDC